MEIYIFSISWFVEMTLNSAVILLNIIKHLNHINIKSLRLYKVWVKVMREYFDEA